MKSYSLLIIIALFLTSCAQPVFNPSLIDDWVAVWNSYDLDALDDLFIQDESLSYFSSEKTGVIRGFEALKKHHEGFGFEPGGKLTKTRLWLESIHATDQHQAPVVTANWFFQKAEGVIQTGPVSIVYAFSNGAYRIQHMHFANYDFHLLPDVEAGSQGWSLDGTSLPQTQPGEAVLDKLTAAQAAWETDFTDLDNWIWLGRWTAYAGDYREAIRVYSRALQHFPGEPKLLRHRGHRYISIREFDRAIYDYELAARWIEGTENEIEPDGMPNAQNIPISTLHGNIWYHLGLAHYLKGNYEESLAAYQKGLAGSTNDDNIVSVSHWIYMIHRLMDHEDLAEQSLDNIREGMKIIENQSYHNLCLFYKGELSEEQLMKDVPATSAGDATRFGLANWYFYNGNKAKSLELFDQILSSQGWASFGYIAAEAAVKY